MSLLRLAFTLNPVRVSRAYQILLLCLLAMACTARLPAALPFAQDAYVWQRDWGAPVQMAIRQHATNFSALVVLKTEVAWTGRRPSVLQIPLDYALLRQTGRPVGLALRVATFPIDSTEAREPISNLVRLAKLVIREAASNQFHPAELQIDFDSPASKLGAYAKWLEELRPAIAPTPLTITTLPNWLDSPGFSNLIRQTDGYVLQVHSWQRPRDFTSPFTLCDPAQARRSVEKAARFKKPFRVALPTYGYVAAFARSGKFLALSAEGPDRDWPADILLKEIHAEPSAMASLIRGWAENQPANLTGVIWFRLPIPTDRLNWPWATLSAVMGGRVPATSAKIEARSPQPGLIEFTLSNTGETEISELAVAIRWPKARLTAADGLAGFEFVDTGPDTAKLRGRSLHLKPQMSLTIGWLRLTPPVEVRCEILPASAF